MSTQQIKQSNSRARIAALAARIMRCPDTMSELRSALNMRRTARAASLTIAERKALDTKAAEYLR